MNIKPTQLVPPVTKILSFGHEAQSISPLSSPSKMAKA